MCSSLHLQNLYKFYTTFYNLFCCLFCLGSENITIYEEQNFKSSSQYRNHVLKTTKKPLNFYASVLFFTDPDTETVHDNMYQIIWL